MAKHRFAQSFACGSGRMLSAATPVIAGDPSTGTIQLGYDSAGRFVSEQYPDGKLVGHQLDGNGNLTKLTYPDDYFVSYGYDQLNRLTDVFLNGSSAAAVHQTFDSISRLSKRTLSNGAETLYAYDGSNALASIAHVYNLTESTNFAYSYNKAHDLISQSVSDSNEMSQPSGSVRNDYVSNNLNRYTSINSAAVTNDTSGNVTQFDSSSFAFNTDNQLTTATVNGATSSFEYDARGRLALISQPGSDTTRFVYEGYRQLADYDSTTGALLTRHILEPSSLEAFADVTASGAPTSWHQDLLGSTVAATDADGHLVGRYNYDPYGNASQLVGGTATPDFGFAGMYVRQPSAVNLTMFRAYSPTIGRWLSRDPLGESISPNSYAYVMNNPSTGTDPLGLFDVFIQWAPAKLAGAPLLVGNHGDLLVTDDNGNVVAGWGGQLQGYDPIFGTGSIKLAPKWQNFFRGSPQAATPASRK